MSTATVILQNDKVPGFPGVSFCGSVETEIALDEAYDRRFDGRSRRCRWQRKDS